MTVTAVASDDDGQVPLDPDNTVRFYYQSGVHGPAGLAWTHRLDDGRWCQADIPLRGHGAGRGEWTVILADPLTVTPALRCPVCKSRAWLDGGKLRAAK